MQQLKTFLLPEYIAKHRGVVRPKGSADISANKISINSFIITDMNFLRHVQVKNLIVHKNISKRIVLIYKNIFFISSHRLNYRSSLNEENKSNGLSQLRELLNKIIETC